jgi:hypothetical protein
MGMKALAAVIVAGCGQDAPKKDVAAIVAGETITVAELDRELANAGIGEKVDPRVRRLALEEIIARKLLAKALASNRQVPDYLLGRKPMADTALDYYEPGKDSEAVHYVETGIEAWRAVPGALEWLADRLGARKPATRYG